MVLAWLTAVSREDERLQIYHLLSDPDNLGTDCNLKEGILCRTPPENGYEKG